jgi:hypothetical protein
MAPLAPSPAPNSGSFINSYAGDDPLADFTPPAEADPALLSTQSELLPRGFLVIACLCL